MPASRQPTLTAPGPRPLNGLSAAPVSGLVAAALLTRKRCTWRMGAVPGRVGSMTLVAEALEVTASEMIVAERVERIVSLRSMGVPPPVCVSLSAFMTTQTRRQSARFRKVRGLTDGVSRSSHLSL